jgi:hypothetical protein
VLETVLIHWTEYQISRSQLAVLIHWTKYQISRSQLAGKILLYDVLMTKQSYGSESVKRYHAVVRCAFNMDGLISNHYRKSSQ